MVSFTQRPLYSTEKATRWALNGRLLGPQGRQGSFWRTENIFATGYRTIFRRSSILYPSHYMYYAIPAPHINKYTAIILYDNSGHSSLRPFCVAADSAALADIPISHESGSTRFIIRFYSPYLKKALEKHFLSARRHNSRLTNPLVHSTSEFFFWKWKQCRVLLFFSFRQFSVCGLLYCLPLNMPTRKNITGSDLAKEEATLLCVLLS